MSYYPIPDTDWMDDDGADPLPELECWLCEACGDDKTGDPVIDEDGRFLCQSCAGEDVT